MTKWVARQFASRNYEYIKPRLTMFKVIKWLVYGLFVLSLWWMITVAWKFFFLAIASWFVARVLRRVIRMVAGGRRQTGRRRYDDDDFDDDYGAGDFFDDGGGGIIAGLGEILGDLGGDGGGFDFDFD